MNKPEEMEQQESAGPPEAEEQSPACAPAAAEETESAQTPEETDRRKARRKPKFVSLPREEWEALQEAARAARETQARVEEYHNALRQKAADYENLRRRTAREKAELHARLLPIEDLLHVLDNLERALAAAEPKGDCQSLLDGVRMTRDQALDALRRKGVERIPALDQPFDPLVHEAVSTIVDPTRPAGTVCAELQPGYRFGDLVLRHSRVVVAQAPPQPAPDTGTAQDDGFRPSTPDC